MAYEGSVELISGIKQANNGTFPLVDASAVRVTDNKRLTDALTDIRSDKADKTDTILETTMSRGRKATTTVGTGSFAFGSNVEASGNYSHAEGNLTIAEGSGSHAEGNQSWASGNHSHAEGFQTTAEGAYSHAEGSGTTSSGNQSHAEGNGTTATGDNSHTEGWDSVASGRVAHAEGYQTVANHYAQHVFGEFNSPDDSDAAATARGNFVEIIGNGLSANARSNARALDWQGNERLKGDLYVGCNADSSGGEKVIPLPSVSSSDDGSILCVVDGEWKLLPMGISKHEVTKNTNVASSDIEAGERKTLYVRITDIPEEMAEKTFEVKSTSVSGLPQGVVGTVLSVTLHDDGNSNTVIDMTVILSNQDSSTKYITSGVVTLTYTYFSY